MIDIKNHSLYSPHELHGYYEKGLLRCDGYDLSEFLGHFLEEMISREEAEKMADDAWREGYESGW